MGVGWVLASCQALFVVAVKKSHVKVWPRLAMLLLLVVVWSSGQEAWEGAP